jgi:hypothetical protein
MIIHNPQCRRRFDAFQADLAATPDHVVLRLFRKSPLDLHPAASGFVIVCILHPNIYACQAAESTFHIDLQEHFAQDTSNSTP